MKKVVAKATLRKILADHEEHSIYDLSRAIQKTTHQTANYLRQIEGVKRRVFQYTINRRLVWASLYRLE